MDTATSSRSQDANPSALTAPLSGMATSQQPRQDTGPSDDLLQQEPADTSESIEHKAFRQSIPVSHQFTEGDTVAQACNTMDLEEQQTDFANANITHHDDRRRDIPPGKRPHESGKKSGPNKRRRQEMLAGAEPQLHEFHWWSNRRDKVSAPEEVKARYEQRHAAQLAEIAAEAPASNTARPPPVTPDIQES